MRNTLLFSSMTNVFQYDQCIQSSGGVSIFSLFELQQNTNKSSNRKRDSPNPPLFLL